jgi:DNA-binding GntR family transcriptional regulator
MDWIDNASPVIINPPRSISDQIYEILRKRILYGEWESGQRLLQSDVAKSFHASRTPVREAFRLLEQDGLVERVAQGGFRVTGVTIEMIEEVFGIRGALEAYAVRLACDRITPGEIASLKRIREQAMNLLDSTELDTEQKLKELFELNSLFHDTIYRATASTYLIKLIHNLRGMVLRMRALGLRADSTWRQAWEEHGQLINWLERKDKETAARFVEKHVAQAAADALSVALTRAKEQSPKKSHPSSSLGTG